MFFLYALIILSYFFSFFNSFFNFGYNIIMNQILNTNLENNNNNNENYQIILHDETHISKKVFKTQFMISIFGILIIISFFSFYYYSLLKKEKLSTNLMDNYEISKLYATSDNSSESNLIIGMIEIPKLNISYPLFSKLDNSLLEISPCIADGKMPPEPSNLCIAGHNYNNDKFFSKINLLNIKDEINIYDNIGQKFSYYVFANYEVKEDDLSPIFNYDNNSCVITLITCNNFNDNRIIIKAKLETPN